MADVDRALDIFGFSLVLPSFSLLLLLLLLPLVLLLASLLLPAAVELFCWGSAVEAGADAAAEGAEVDDEDEVEERPLDREPEGPAELLLDITQPRMGDFFGADSA